MSFLFESVLNYVNDSKPAVCHVLIQLMHKQSIIFHYEIKDQRQRLTDIAFNESRTIMSTPPRLHDFISPDLIVFPSRLSWSYRQAYYAGLSALRQWAVSLLGHYISSCHQRLQRGSRFASFHTHFRAMTR